MSQNKQDFYEHQMYIIMSILRSHVVCNHVPWYIDCSYTVTHTIHVH